MNVFSIGLTEAQELESMFDRESFDNIEKEGFYTLGVLDEEDFVAGVLQFSVHHGTDSKISAQIEYIFVPEDFRGSGAGTALVNEYISILKASGITEGYIELSKDLEDELSGFFSSFGFFFDYKSLPVYEITVDTLVGNKALQKVSADRCRSISYLDDGSFADLLRQTGCNLTSDEKTGFDEEVSCYYDEEGKSGLFLADKRGTALQAAFLGCDNGKHDKKLLELLAYATGKASQMYEGGTKVRIVCRESFTKNLMEKLFPGIKPLKVVPGMLQVTHLKRNS